VRSHRRLWRDDSIGVDAGFHPISGKTLHCGIGAVLRGVCLSSQLGCATAHDLAAAGEHFSVGAGAFGSESATSLVDGAAHLVVGQPSRGIRVGDRIARPVCCGRVRRCRIGFPGLAGDCPSIANLGSGSHRLHSRGATQSQRHSDVLVPDRDSAISGHAEIYRRMGFSEFPRSETRALCADADRLAVLFVGVAETGKAARSNSAPGDDRRSIAVRETYFHFCAGGGTDPQRPGGECMAGLGRAISFQFSALSKKIAVNSAVLAAFLVFSAVRVRTVVAHQPTTEAENFPEGAVSFLALQHLPGPILNHYKFGGYFIWKLYPDYLVFIDGRADLYGDQFLRDFADAYYVTDPDRQRLIRQWRIRTVVLPPDSPLLAALKLTHSWNEAYGDSQAVILTRAATP
jgi:hypothetical protein